MEGTTPSWKPVARVAGYVLGAAALVPLAYYGMTFIVPSRCPECDAKLNIVKRSANWEPELLPADEGE